MKKKTILIIISFLLIIPVSINAEEKNGFIKENGYTYYYKNGKIQKGITEIDGDKYFLGEYSGKIQIGMVTSSLTGETYFADNTGKILSGFFTVGGYTYYFNDELKKGITEIDGYKYFLGEYSGKVQKGFVTSSITGRTYYTDNSGKIQTGFLDIKGYTYYFNDDLKYGITRINGEDYFLGEYSGKVQKGLVTSSLTGKTYYTDNTGKIQTGFLDIKGYTYYFNNDLKYGITKINGENYFLGEYSGKVQKGLVTSSLTGKTYYTDNSGKIQKGFIDLNGYRYYFNEDLKKGVTDINGEKYFLGEYSGKMQKGFIISSLTNDGYFANEEGILQSGFITINNKEKYFDPTTKKMYRGLSTIGDNKYYFDNNGNKVTGKVAIGDNYYYFNEQGVLEKIQYIPTYYKQKDPRWSDYKYGERTLGKTGCAPTSLAMAFRSIVGKHIFPYEVADYLYYYTNEYNKYTVGASGLAILYATDHYNVNRTPIQSVDQLKEELKKGKIVFAAMGEGKFATKDWNHAIILFNYDESKNSTYAYDPLVETNNGWISVYQIWNEKSTDPDDARGGAILYSLG